MDILMLFNELDINIELDKNYLKFIQNSRYLAITSILTL